MAAARRYWFALMVCGVLLGLSLPFYLTPGRFCGPQLPEVEGGFGCVAEVSSPQGILGGYALGHPGAVQLYWLVALVLGSCALGWWYRRAGEARRAVVGVLVAVLLAAVTTALTWADWHGFRSPSAWAETPMLMVFNGATPLLVIAPVLLALAVVERSAGLLAFAVGFCALAYVCATRDSFGVFHALGLPVDVFSDPAGIRQLLNLAVPAAVLLLAAGVVYGAGAVGRRRP
ncbi:hypothetical protein [Kitasatospora sp. NPDC059673]|uniref:hypothetical protein n=1 Tax=Kitasatospora sp. NPDC059673 TaxID=3346901 RepID=UPI003673DF52